MIVWNQKLGREECPYMRRWVIDFWIFSIRIHQWFSSDDQRNFHDHPWWYVSFVTQGSYIDVNPEGEIERTRWSIKSFPASHKHTVKVAKGGCWTVMLTGREKRQWGFWVKGKFRKRNRYFYDHRHHPCE